MNSFRIGQTELLVNPNYSSIMTINSHPKPYQVEFKSFNGSFTQDQIVLIDANVQQLYNIQHDRMIIIEATEDNKSIETALHICSMLMSFEFDKGNTLIVIGGGIIQDLGAYVAKTFRRGINWIYYPTTLLSQCDSCIGGKTALNFHNYKNQLALFSAPSKVIIDIKFLSTLKPQDTVSGYGEIVKLFLIGGDYYINNFDFMSMEEKIYHSLAIKKAVVEFDEFENYERKSLNYGHSFGHVIEPMEDYLIPHGEAVMLGIELINRIFTKSQIISDLIGRFTSLDKIKHLDIKKLVSGLKTDKKVAGGIISLVVVSQPGTTIFVNHPINKTLEDLVYEILTN